MVSHLALKIYDTDLILRLLVAYAHIIKGKSVQGKVVPYPCDTELVIYVPVVTDKEPNPPKKAVILLRDPHTHPVPANLKPTNAQKQIIDKAIHEAGSLGLTAGKIRKGESL